MAGESLLTRWWSAVRPLPKTQTLDAATMLQKRKQRRLIRITLGVLILLGGAYYAYDYAASAPQRAQAELRKGIARMSPSSYGEAIVAFDKAIAIQPELAEAWLNRGIAQHNSSQREAALSDLQHALDLNPSLTRAHDERGQIYVENKDYAKAMLEFNESLKVNPTLDGYYHRAQTYALMGEHEKAIADYTLAIAEYRESPYLYRARATSKRALGDKAGGQDDQDRAATIESGKPVGLDVLLKP
jgi:tetratricopeptide (TPR) repeat protein